MPELLPIPQPSSAASLADERQARLPRRLRRHVAALSLVGATLVVLPVVQLLRYQAAELNALSAGRAKLDPVARAVHLQRGLLAHRDIAGQVLGGHPALEPERKLRQNEVDGRMAAMMVALATGRWDLAIGEADDLHQDWRQLTQQVSARSIDPPGSDRAHRLLVEQTLQVIDLVAAAAQIERNSGTAYSPGNVPAATLAIVHLLPRLAWQTALLAPGALADGASATVPGAADAADAQAQHLQIARVEASLARTLGLLEGTRQASHSASGVAPAPAIDAALLQAGATAGAATERFITLLRRPAVSPAEQQAAGNAAVQAQMRLFELAHGTATAALTAQTRSAAQHRALLLGALTGLSLIALALVAHLWRGLLLLQAREQALADQAAAPGDGGDPLDRRTQGQQLFSRLRASPAEVEPATPATHSEPAQPPRVR
jgi:hypothetical protein